MKSLFFRLFLWFCAASVLLVIGIVVGYVVTNPDQLPYAWPHIGRGAIVFAARGAIQAWEQGGVTELRPYLDHLEQDTEIRGALFDSAGRELGDSRPDLQLPENMRAQPETQLVMLGRHMAAVRLQGVHQRYVFLVRVPRRESSGLWSRVFVGSFIITGGLLCFLLARHITLPVIHLRALTARFATGDLGARVTAPSVLERGDEIGGLARDFNQMASRIETLMRAQQRLIADVSHELRSPITRLSLALGLVRRDPSTSLARMQREVERLNTLIAQLLMLSRLESLSQPPMQILDLAAVIAEVSSDADFEAASMDRSVRVLESASCMVRGEPDLIRSAVENVVRNALKYTDDGTQVSIRLVHVDDSRTADILVDDHGPGVPPEALDHMFEPFYRVDEARDRRSGGAGLGLAIARHIVALHSGAIQASNRSGGGLQVRITLPISSTDKS